MLSTIYEISSDNSKVIYNWWHPHEISSNANTVHYVFEDAYRKELKILQIINNYNHYMDGIDIADQLCECYNCQLT
ncbi:9854_t:CDS:1, partial [Cetraspora pellucida]